MLKQNRNLTALAFLVFVAPSFAADNTVDLADMWNTTAAKNVRSVHNQNVYQGKNSSKNASFFLQTSWSRNGNPKVIGDLVSESKFDALTDSFLSDNQDLKDLLKTITMQGATAGANFHLSFSKDNYRLGVDAPIVTNISHL